MELRQEQVLFGDYVPIDSFSWVTMQTPKESRRLAMLSDQQVALYAPLL